MDWSALPFLGVGLGYRDLLRSQIFLNRTEIDFLEIIVEHYLDATPEKEDELHYLQQHFTLVPHGIHLSLGSVSGVDSSYLEKVARLFEKIRPPWWSEHLSFTVAGGVDIGHLSPLPFTEEAIHTVCKNIEKVRSFLKEPLLLENITYLVQLPGQMSEAEFLREVLLQSGCGLLLDVTNLYTNAMNFSENPQHFLAKIPLDLVIQLHFVGGHWQNQTLIDSHSQATPSPVWELMEQVISRSPHLKGAILERDENFPPFSELVQELQKARQRWRFFSNGISQITTASGPSIHG